MNLGGDLIGVIPIITSVMSFCPAYLPFNISTLEKINNLN